MKIALVAHDGRKQELLDWIKYNYKVLTNHQLIATGTTGRLINDIEINETVKERTDSFGREVIERNSNKPFDGLVECKLSGPLGGDQQIGAMIAERKIDVLIFFCDNLIMQGHQNDVSALSRLASLYNIAFATNRTTADMIISSPLFGNPEYEMNIPACIEHYKNRKI